MSEQELCACFVTPQEHSFWMSSFSADEFRLFFAVDGTKASGLRHMYSKLDLGEIKSTTGFCSKVEDGAEKGTAYKNTPKRTKKKCQRLLF